MAKRAPKRDEDLTSVADETALEDIFVAVSKGIENQRDRSDEIKDNWELYNCQLSDKQFYNGQSKISLPFIHDAVEAQVTRYANQLFPQSGRYVEVTTGDADLPQAYQALLETYVRKCKLRTEIVPALLRNGPMEGTYIVYVDWQEIERNVVFRAKTQPTTDDLPNEAAEPVDDFKEEELIDAWPGVEVISDADFILIPAASNSIDGAIDAGGSASILRRWSKGMIKQKRDQGEITKSACDDLIEAMDQQRASKDVDTAKDQLDAAGIKERGKVALVYETWTKLKIKGERVLCRIYFGGEDRILGVKRCPYWNDRPPILGSPVRKMSSTFKSVPPVHAVTDMQIFANDTINEGADTAHFSAMPIVMTDPLKNPRVETMTLGLAAVWETSPNDTTIVQFPELWSSALDRAGAIKEQIFQTLSVNPSMIPQSSSSGKKKSQAELAMEQQVDLLTTADAVSILEESILTPLMQRFAEYDHQFRDKATTIRMYGPMGEEANMEMVEPIQLNSRYEFRWYGLEASRSAAQMQAQTAWLNVVKGMPPQMYPDYDLDLAPMLARGTENVFGPRDARLIFKKKRMISVDPMMENEMLISGFTVQVHPADDDAQHIQAHMMVVQAGDPHQKAAEHILMHQQQMSMKAQAQQQPQQGQPGGGGGGAGQPRSGASAGPPKPAQQPAGAVHKDNMPAHGVVQMPRKTG